MKRKLTIEDLPADVVGKMKEIINKDNKVLMLRAKWRGLIASGQYAQAMQTQKVLNGLEERVINEYLSRYEGEAERMENLMQDMPDEDREEMNVSVNAIIFLADQIESLVMECNSILQRNHPEYRLEMFDRLTDMGREAKEHVRFMSQATQWVYQTNFGDFADSMNEMVMNKARAFVRKMKRVGSEAKHTPEQT